MKFVALTLKIPTFSNRIELCLEVTSMIWKVYGYELLSTPDPSYHFSDIFYGF